MVMEVVEIEGGFMEISEIQIGFGTILRRSLRWRRGRSYGGKAEAGNVVQGQFVGVGVLGSNGGGAPNAAVNAVEIVHYRIADGSVEEGVSEW